MMNMSIEDMTKADIKMTWSDSGSMENSPRENNLMTQMINLPYIVEQRVEETPFEFVSLTPQSMYFTVICWHS